MMNNYMRDSMKKKKRKFALRLLMNYLNIPMSNSILQKIGFLFCVDRGVNFGGNPISRRKSFEFSKDFMRKTLIEKHLILKK